MRRVAIAANGLTALAAVLLPWYALDDYKPSGWDATWWARAVVAAVVVAIVALRLRRDRIAVLATVFAVAFVVYRVAAPPDFGFGFDGLDVPVERLAGCWVALGAALTALLASSRLAWRPPPASPEPASPPPPGPSSAPAAP